MNPYKIEKNVPMPDYYPFEEMEVGDPFLVCPVGTSKARRAVTVRKLETACRAHLTNGYNARAYRHFQLRGGSVRVWRIR